MKPGPKPRPAIVRFWPKVNVTSGCWLWSGKTGRDGYGRFRDDAGRTVLAHRWLYELAHGSVSPDLTLDHVRSRGCASRACVRPDHLEPVSNRENILRGDSPTAHQARQITCKRGHDLAFAYRFTDAKGSVHRNCRECQRLWQRGHAA